ncbi:MAG: LAGLIDADG family homing endonuclease [Burkholderiales bacterium]
MAAYRKVGTLDPCDAAYLGGLVDGEGTVTLTAQHRNENRRLVLSISNTELPLLEFVRRIVGAGHITTKRTYSEKHSPSFTYQINGRQALSLLAQIAPYLRTYKSKRAKLVLRDYVRLTPRNGKYTQKMKRQREEFERQLLGVLPAQRSLPRSANDRANLT